jgi:histidyl-tRNA synthetase
MSKSQNKVSKQGLQAPKGMHDILPEEQPWWDRVHKVSRELAEFYGFGKIDTPMLEQSALFERGVGGETDIVGKEMYTLKTKGGDVLALKPENTASVMRAYFEHHMSRGPQPRKFFYYSPFFRHENPQAGRFRQFFQLGFETIGGADPIYDAQMILIFQRLLEDLRIKNIALKVNSIGCRVCRPIYKRVLQNYYKNYEKKICGDCSRRLKTNPLRLLDCKKEQCQEWKANAPTFFDKLCNACSTHLKSVLEYLDELQISYTLDNQLVRGLDYYSRTVFEFYVEGTGVEAGALLGGGRYDYLGEMIGGRIMPAVGGASGVERLISVMKVQEIKLPARGGKKVFMIHVGELAKKKSLGIIEDLRKAGISVAESLGKEALKSQLKTADQEGAELALIFGQREIFEESIIIRDLKKSLQENVPLRKLVEEVKKRLK